MNIASLNPEFVFCAHMKLSVPQFSCTTREAGPVFAWRLCYA